MAAVAFHATGGVGRVAPLAASRNPVAAVAFHATSLMLAIHARGASQPADPTGLPIANPELIEQTMLEQSAAVEELPQLDADPVGASPTLDLVPVAPVGASPTLDLVPVAPDDASPLIVEPAPDDVPQIPGPTTEFQVEVMELADTLS